jgi:hypothetical protein
VEDQSKSGGYIHYTLSAGTSPMDAWRNILAKNQVLVMPDFMEPQETMIILSKKDAEYLAAHGAIAKKGE